MEQSDILSKLLELALEWTVAMRVPGKRFSSNHIFLMRQWFLFLFILGFVTSQSVMLSHQKSDTLLAI